MMKKKVFSVGREADCEIPVADGSVSRKHAEVELTTDGNLFVVDCFSMNKTFIVRGGTAEQITQGIARPGEIVRFGNCDFPVADLIALVRARLNEQQRNKKVVIDENVKRVRCSICGCVKPEGEACPECNTKSRRV
jgi:pSer/pThr/pTyr-binding forkhead associated (FHA) protein